MHTHDYDGRNLEEWLGLGKESDTRERFDWTLMIIEIFAFSLLIWVVDRLV